jgi:hypothetical protein
MADLSKNDGQTGTRERPGLFKPGGPGGPGRPAGSRNAATLLLDKLAEGDAEAILKQVTDAAKGGDMRAAEIVLARIWPVRKGRPISLAEPLPSIKSAADVAAALGILTGLVGGGELTPEEGAAVAAIIETKRKAIETVELEGRIAALEKERK